LNPRTPHQAARLPRPRLALRGIDRSERNHHVGVLGRDARHLLVRVAPESRLALGIDGKDDATDPARPVMVRRFLHGRQMVVAALEIFRHRGLELVVAVVPRTAARLLGMGMNVERDQFVDLHAAK
jgi:hypothetical protein